MTKEVLISSEGKSPTVVVVRESGGVAISQRGRVICLDRQELARLIAATSPEPTTPAKARLMRYPATKQTDEPSDN